MVVSERDGLGRQRPVAWPSVLEADKGIVGILPPYNGASCPLGDGPLSGSISSASLPHPALLLIFPVIPQQDQENKFKHTQLQLSGVIYVF